MYILQVAFVMFIGLVAVIAITGSVGILNLALLGLQASPKTHLLTWVTCVAVLAAVGFGMPRYINTSADGDRLEFSYTRPTPTPTPLPTVKVHLDVPDPATPEKCREAIARLGKPAVYEAKCS